MANRIKVFIVADFEPLRLGLENAIAGGPDMKVTGSVSSLEAMATSGGFRGADVLVVDMGAGKAEINVFKTGSLRFSRCLETGGLDVTREISAGLGVTLQDAEAAKKKVDVLSSSSEHDKVFSIVKARLDTLLLEVRRSIEYYKTTFREPGVEHTILTGGGALAHGIKDYFSMQIDGNIEIDEPFSPMSFKKKAIGEFGGISPRFSTAVGLALRKF